MEEFFFGKNQYSLGELGTVETIDDGGNAISWKAVPPVNNHCCSFASLLVLRLVDTDINADLLRDMSVFPIQDILENARMFYELFLHSQTKYVLPDYEQTVAIISKRADLLFIEGKILEERFISRESEKTGISLIIDTLDAHMFEKDVVLFFITLGSRSYSVIFVPPNISKERYKFFTFIETHGKYGTNRVENYAIQTDDSRDIAIYLSKASGCDTTDSLSAEIRTFISAPITLDGIDEISLSDDDDDIEPLPPISEEEEEEEVEVEEEASVEEEEEEEEAREESSSPSDVTKEGGSRKNPTQKVTLFQVNSAEFESSSDDDE